MKPKKKLCKLWHIPLHILHLTWTISCVKCYPPIGPRAIRGNWWFKNILILFYHNILERMCDISYFVQANLLLSKLSPAQSQGSLFSQLEKKKLFQAESNSLAQIFMFKAFFALNAQTWKLSQTAQQWSWKNMVCVHFLDKYYLFNFWFWNMYMYIFSESADWADSV